MQSKFAPSRIGDKIRLMIIKSLPIAVFGLILFGATGWAQVSVLEGKVTGTDGRLLQGAEVRIARQDKKEAPIVVKTDVNGRYSAKTVPAGIYAVGVFVNGTIKTALRNVRVQSPATRLEFDLKNAASGKVTVKHYVWVQAKTGSRIGGGFVEVNDVGSATGAGANNIQTMPGSALRELQSNAVFKPPGQ